MNDAQGFLGAKRRVERAVLYYLIVNPEITLKNDNKRVMESLLEIEAAELQSQKPNLPHETARQLAQWRCESEVKSIAVHRFDQDQIDLFHPDQEKNNEYYESLIIAMAMYFCDIRN